MTELNRNKKKIKKNLTSESTANRSHENKKRLHLFGIIFKLY